MTRKTTYSVCQTVDPFRTKRIKIIWQVKNTAARIIRAEHQPAMLEMFCTVRTNVFSLFNLSTGEGAWLAMSVFLFLEI
jgi:uncharacterized pyridoxamine 5'-phosphate oxidase family protein